MVVKVHMYFQRKNIMEKYVANLDLYEMYEEANKMIYAALAKVDAGSEYQSFIHQNRRLGVSVCVCVRVRVYMCVSVCVIISSGF